MSEASKSDKVGFMRNGEVLIEGSPEEIVQKFCVKSLDQAFFNLSYHQENRNETALLDEPYELIEQNEKEQCKTRKNSYRGTFKTIGAILHKDFIQVRRHGIFLAFQAIFPVLVIILVSFSVLSLYSKLLHK